MSRVIVTKCCLALALVVCSLTMVGCPSQDVIVMDNYPEFSLEKLWANTVSFFYDGSSASPLDVGDIIVGTDGGGFLRRLTAVNEKNGSISTQTEFVSLAEAIDAGTLDADVTFNADDFAKSGVPPCEGQQRHNRS